MLDAPEPAPAHLAQPDGNIRRQWTIVSVLCVVALVAAGGVLLWDAVTFTGSGHSHGPSGTSAAVGEPGDPSLPARIIEVAMVEGDGMMRFEPSAIEVAKGEQVRFKITNNGVLGHEFVLATLSENLQHLEEMKKLPGMVHNTPNSITLSPNASGEVLWRFGQVGSFDFSCLIPGHREAGMHGSVVVK
jgi:uncharacterized cupredoxin-like copper-binding protein